MADSKPNFRSRRLALLRIALRASVEAREARNEADRLGHRAADLDEFVAANDESYVAALEGIVGDFLKLHDRREAARDPWDRLAARARFYLEPADDPPKGTDDARESELLY